ncbi:phage minor capsid protein [Rhodococcus sp. NPDC003994]
MADEPTPVSEEDVAGMEAPVAAEYTAAEYVLLGMVSAQVLADVKAGVTSPVAGITALRRRVRSYVAGVTQRGRQAARRALDAAAAAGRASAERTLGSRSPRSAPVPPVTADPDRQARRDADAVRETLLDLRATAPTGPPFARGVTVRTPNALLPQLTAMTPRMLAGAEGMYREVMARVLDAPLRSEADRLRLAQKYLDDAATKGINGFVDSRGRRWTLTSYVEMATRTAATQTAIDAHVQLLADNGYDLVRVSVHPNCSNLCAPFQGNLLSVTGATGPWSGGAAYHQRIVDSLAGARARGFNHPNCKHFVALWVPGDPLPTAPEVIPEHYRATQRLRYLERHVRAAKRREAVALDRDAQIKARASIRRYQAMIREHVAAHPTVPRMRRREQIDIAL